MRALRQQASSGNGARAAASGGGRRAAAAVALFAKARARTSADPGRPPSRCRCAGALQGTAGRSAREFEARRVQGRAVPRSLDSSTACGVLPEPGRREGPATPTAELGSREQTGPGGSYMRSSTDDGPREFNSGDPVARRAAMARHGGNPAPRRRTSQPSRYKQSTAASSTRAGQVRVTERTGRGS